MKFLFLLFILGCALALPRPPHHHRRAAQQLAAARLRRAPAAAAARQRTMLISGYYRPLYAQRRTGFEPETAMAAFATGDSVAAGSYLGAPACAACDDEPLAEGEPQSDLGEQAPLEDAPLEGAPAPQEPAQDYAGEAELAPLRPSPPARTPKKKPVKKVQEDDEEDNDAIDEEAAVPTKGRKPYNTFFPVVFSGYGGATRSGAPGGGAGGVTAIANSYSTGKGGVATSHATAYGAPPAGRSRKRVVPEEDAEEE